MATSSQSAPSVTVSRQTLLLSRGLQFTGPDSLRDLQPEPLTYRLQWDMLDEWTIGGLFNMFWRWWNNLAQDELDAVDATFTDYYMLKRPTWEALPQPIRVQSKEDLEKALHGLYIEPHNLAVQSKAIANTAATAVVPTANIMDIAGAQKQENKAKKLVKKLFTPYSAKSQTNRPLTVGTANTSGTGTPSTTATPLVPSKHSTIEGVTHLTTPMLGDADLCFEYQGFARGIFLVKASPRITEQAIDDVFDSGIHSLIYRLA